MRVAPAAPYSFWQRLVACAARPCGAAATMTEAHLVAHKRLTGAEVVPVTATRPRVGDPLPGHRRHQLAQHNYRPKASAPPALAGEDGSAARS